VIAGPVSVGCAVSPVVSMGIRGTARRVEILNDGAVKFSTLIEEK
jgi:hypothetical protein